MIFWAMPQRFVSYWKNRNRDLYLGSHLHLSIMTYEDVTVCRVKRMTCRLKSDRGNSAVRPRSLREV